MKAFMQLLIIRLCLFFGLLYRKICIFLCGNCMQGDAMLFGELIVVGHDKVDISLGHRPPNGVHVQFVNEHVHVPCNPKHHDELKYEVKNVHEHHQHDHRNDHCNHQDNYVLTISWHVTGIRVIKWVVYY